MTKIDEKKLISTFKEIKAIFDANKIPIWLEYGTLLGFAKEKRIFPWDDDFDLGTLKDYLEDEKIKKKLSEDFEKRGFSVYYFPKVMDIERGDLNINILLVDLNKNRDFSYRVAYLTFEESGKFLLKLYKTLNVAYYGSLKFDRKTKARFLAKRTLFRLFQYFPGELKNSIYRIVYALLSNFCKIHVYYLKVSAKHFLKLKNAYFYGLKVKIPSETGKYLEKLYDKNWKKPYDASKAWHWWKHGEWKENGSFIQHIALLQKTK